MNRLLLTAAIATLFAAPASALPIGYTTGMSYTNSFDGLPTTGSATLTGRGPHDIQGVAGAVGMGGWTMSNFGGASTDTAFRAQDGSLSGATGGGLASFGTTADRALGLLASADQLSRFGVAFVNNSSRTFTHFKFTYYVEQWRRGDVPAPGNSMTSAIAITADPAANINSDSLFGQARVTTSPNTQAAPTNVALLGSQSPNFKFESYEFFPSLGWRPGQTLLIRFTGQDRAGEDDALAIDDFVFVGLPEPSCLALASCALAALAAARRR